MAKTHITLTVQSGCMHLSCVFLAQAFPGHKLYRAFERSIAILITLSFVEFVCNDCVKLRPK